MSLNPLTAVSPIDGRYYKKLAVFSEYFSEYALMGYRVKVEVEYFLALAKEGVFDFSDENKAALRKVVEDFSMKDAETIKKKERTTNHDVKAVEYFIKDKLNTLGCAEEGEWIHFGLTSQDINNTAYPLMWKAGIQNVFLPQLQQIIEGLEARRQEWKDQPMLARTHGQPATPTTLGKEINVFIQRLKKQKKQLEDLPFSAKFGGATGNFNAHHVAYPEKDWERFADYFVQDILHLNRTAFTTQIEPYDDLSAQFDAVKRINTVLLDLSRDIWTYISMEYFKQKIIKGEIGSSTMPHKINPIDFENAEGNLGIANALFTHFSAKFPISRLQRDLSDSTVLRNIGVPLAHSFLALKSLEKGLGKLILNASRLEEDLEANWAVVAEAIQTILRREKYPKPYEALKDLTRKNKEIDKKAIRDFIESLNVTEKVKEELKTITPHNYTGIF